ncbi:MAG: type IV toxin-antitoxin system AbiEi family antitoxin [Verrucomicrobia bacterium]|nr:type IV toxin-antitoxin system AbiEi family antitoxin [Verrucomicrobiota bacterium]MBU4289457.1 type IV toxin-antitoxin system AbiEi family antitoxin [Verrucomicrobiota bacterium]MBU4428727.1 type IV toxin-antitoxin system AbiEi family antitoxin [Verrucomicrobiota bacterium]MBU4497271.1 type IV toxin-antitoxin system AbiEi family antitoxin [Verrucomicrobiota bacterium]MCG2679164.1 type IV toxin-antitoxin system AbiEi family antitoxin [Kiritimatiellia bacterium]
MKVPGSKQYGALEAWVEALPSQGRYSFTRNEAMNVFGLNRKAFNRSAGRLSARKKIARIHGKFYVVVPLEHAAVGVVPADWFIVKLMEHLGRPFYVGALSAAEYHGAAHQRPQRYQVVTDRPLRDIACRGVGVRFFVKKNLRGTPVQRFKGVTGYIPVSTPEATAIDLIRYSRRVGGLDQVLTVLQELGEVLNPVKLVAAAKLDGNVAYAQRLGWLLEKSAFAAKVVRLAHWVSGRKPLPAKLEPSVPLRGSVRDKRWNLWINSEVEGDLS